MENNTAIKGTVWSRLSLRLWLGFEQGRECEGRKRIKTLTNQPGEANSHHHVKAFVPE